MLRLNLHTQINRSAPERQSLSAMCCGKATRAPLTLGLCSSPDKMNDLYSVALAQSRLCPFVTADDQLVKLDGYSRRRQRQLRDEISQGRSIAHFPTLTVESNQQCLVFHLRRIWQAE